MRQIRQRDLRPLVGLDDGPNCQHQLRPLLFDRGILRLGGSFGFDERDLAWIDVSGTRRGFQNEKPRGSPGR